MSRVGRLALFVAISLLANQSTEAGEAAEVELKALAERAAAGMDVAKLRHDLLEFRRRYPGTGHAVAAAALLRDLPSPLDKLSPAAIAEIEKFAWHPKETVAILGEHRGRQGGAATALAWSRNGKWLVSSSTNGYVRIWDAATMRLLHTLGHGGGFSSATFSKDSTLLAVGGGDGYVRLWEMQDDKTLPKALGAYKVSSVALLGLALAPDKKWFVTGGGDSRLYYWDLTQEPPRETTGANTHPGGIQAVAVSNDGKTIASAGADKWIRLWFVDSQNQMRERAAVEAHAGVVHCLAWHPLDDKVLASGGADGAIRIWGIVDGKSLRIKTTLKCKGGAVQSLAYSPTGKTLAAACADNTIRTYTVAAGSLALTEKSVYEGHAAQATGVAFSPDGSTIASSSYDWTIRQWPGPLGAGPKPKDKTVKSGHLSHVYTLAFGPDEKGLASGSYDATARYWELGGVDVKERSPPMKSDGYVYTLAFTPDGKSVVTGGQSGKIRTFDIATSKMIHLLQGHTGYINRLAC
ncbi:MAG: hypothetical protein NZO58_07885 [Gemmataceae bacterium]|nr:hypothetical protein [Gemmataceae bacterium]